MLKLSIIKDREWGQGTKISKLRHENQAAVHLYAQLTQPQGKGRLAFIGREDKWAPKEFRARWRRSGSRLYREFKHGYPAQRQSNY